MPVCTTQGPALSPGCSLHRVRVWVPLSLFLEENLLGATTVLQEEGAHQKKTGFPHNLPLITSGLSK